MTKPSIQQLIERLEQDVKSGMDPDAVKTAVATLKAVFGENPLEEIPLILDFQVRDDWSDKENNFAKIIGDKSYSWKYKPEEGEHWGKHAVMRTDIRRDFQLWLEENYPRGADIHAMEVWTEDLNSNRERMAWDQVDIHRKAAYGLHDSKVLLREAAKQFRFYEANHRAKNTEDSLKKAEVNKEQAERIENFLAELEQKDAS